MYEVIEFAAVVASSSYGVLLARRHQLDFVGVFCLAFIVAFGGGTLRDLSLDRHPLFWIQEAHYPVVVFFISLVTSLLPRIPKHTERFISVPDALGLGLFSIAGVNAAVTSGTSLFIAALMGTVTGTFGGAIGDVICNRVPSLFRAAPLFATCSFLGCWIFILMQRIPAAEPYAAATAISFIVTLRLLAIRNNWQLPQLTGDDPKE